VSFFIVYSEMGLTSRYGLSWSPVNKGHIVSAGEDDYVCHWYACVIQWRARLMM